MAPSNGKCLHIIPYTLHIDYLKTPDGWWIPNFYEFSGEDDKTIVEYINVYLS
jgi:hypothetical protein